MNRSPERRRETFVPRLLWFAALWAGGVLVVASVAYLLRMALNT